MRFSLILWAPTFFFFHCLPSQFVALQEDCPRQAPSIIDPKEYQTCFHLMEKKLKFDKSFFQSQKGQEAKTKITQVFTDLFFVRYTWPDQNRLLAFPDIVFPKEFVCLFVPERDPAICHFSPHAKEKTPMLSHRLVNYLLTHIRMFIYPQVLPPERANTIMDVNMWRVVRVYPLFFQKPWFDQVSVLFHEAMHIPLKNHTPCKWISGAQKKLDCDETLSQSCGMDLLAHELTLRSEIQTVKERVHLSQLDWSSGKPTRVKQEHQFAAYLFHQCELLRRIRRHPPVPKELASCQEQDALLFVQNHPVLFGFPLEEELKNHTDVPTQP